MNEMDKQNVFIIDTIPSDLIGKDVDGDVIFTENETKIISIIDDLKNKGYGPVTLKSSKMEDTLPNDRDGYIINPKDPQRNTKELALAYIIGEHCNAGDFSLLNALLGLNTSN